jgi:MoxR-like ATPase
VAIEDIISVAPMVLRHRIITNFRAETEKMNSEKIISELVSGLRSR